MGTAKRKTFMRCFAAMVDRAYGYNVRDPKRGPAPVTRIVSDLASRGVMLDELTVRDWLKEAREYFLPV